MMPYLEFNSLTKRYGCVKVLDDVNLSVTEGSVLALLGPNGAGKSTLFGCLLGCIYPTAGAIRIRDEIVCDIHRNCVGYVAERVALYAQRTVRENGLFFARLKGQTGSELDRQLKRVGMDTVQDRLVRHLSKGMLQRLGLAIALCGKPELLVLDEPFNGLDPAVLDTLQEILRQEQSRGATLLIATHTMSAVESLATHVAILLQGRLVIHLPIAELRAEYRNEASLEAIYHRIARETQMIGEVAA